MKRRKSKVVAMSCMVAFFALVAISVILMVTHNVKMKQWSDVGKTTVTENGESKTVRYDPLNGEDTSTYRDAKYMQYVFGRTVTGEGITDRIPNYQDAQIKYDENEQPVEVFLPGQGKAAPFKAEEFLRKFAQQKWCLVPTTEAAIFASWMWFLKFPIIVGLIGTFAGWRIARAVSKMPLSAKPGRGSSSSRGGKVNKGSLFRRCRSWLKGVRKGKNSANVGRGRGH